MNNKAREKVQGWIDRMRGNDELLAAVQARLAKRTLGLIAKGFRNEQNPYGEAWAPKKRPDGRKILHGKTGQLRRFRALQVAPRLFVVVPGADYAAVHQAPQRGQTQRMMVPTVERGLPDEWKRSLSRAAIAELRDHFEPKPPSEDSEDSTADT